MSKNNERYRPVASNAVDDVLRLGEIWNLFPEEEQAEVLNFVVRRLIAVQLLRVAKKADDEAVDEQFVEIAESSMPGGEVSSLLTRLRDRTSNTDCEFFDGYSDTLLAPASRVRDAATSAYADYVYWRSTLENSQMWDVPTPEEYFGIDAHEVDYMDSDGEVDEDARHAEIRERCIDRFEIFVRKWRQSFFASLVEGQ